MMFYNDWHVRLIYHSESLHNLQNFMRKIVCILSSDCAGSM